MKSLIDVDTKELQIRAMALEEAAKTAERGQEVAADDDEARSLLEEALSALQHHYGSSYSETNNEDVDLIIKIERYLNNTA